MFTATPQVRRKARTETVARAFFALMSMAMVVPLLAIVGYVIYRGWPVLSWVFLTTNPSHGGTAGGIWSALVGTIYIVSLSLAISAPIGVLAAVYLNEYAKDTWFTRVVNLAVVNLAGVPSIVHGLFGVGAFVYFLSVNGGRKSILAAALTLAVMTLPVIIASTKEALASVPTAFREACWNVGATRWQTIRRIVLPNSVSGILTGVILQVSRTAGETAPVMLTGVTTWKMIEQTGLFLYHPVTDQCMALSMHLYYIATQASGAPKALPFAIATVLIGAVLAVNAAAIAIRVTLRSRKKW
ncbi:MAG: phosphate ABC transporter, permease protein PstA [Verrucomicrobia bacterium A1]|nr:MAG: phosphate ABC transporter, permease protein PstA [Verrucomicrobia bacterium A1]